MQIHTFTMNGVWLLSSNPSTVKNWKQNERRKKKSFAIPWCVCVGWLRCFNVFFSFEFFFSPISDSDACFRHARQRRHNLLCKMNCKFEKSARCLVLVHICRINDAMSVLDATAAAARRTFFCFNLRSLTLAAGRVHITSICSDSKLLCPRLPFAGSQTRVAIELSNNARNMRACVRALWRFGKSLVWNSNLVFSIFLFATKFSLPRNPCVDFNWT